MNLLILGGTGTISAEVVALLLRQNHQVTIVNRGNKPVPKGAASFVCSVTEEEKLRHWLIGKHFDAVADFIAFRPEDVERDIRLFSGKTNQYVFISSASAYQKPLQNYRITESTPLVNPFWQYSRDKIACEQRLMEEYRTSLFPVTIVRPSHTYGNTSVPVGIHGKYGSWQTICRMMAGKPVIVHGDGTSLWTMTHSSDFAKGFVELLGNIHAIGEAVHITSDESVTWNQIYEILYQTLGAEPNLVHISSEFLEEASGENHCGQGLLGDKANTVVFDNGKLKKLVPGFHASVRVDQGLPAALRYMLEHSDVQRQDPEFDLWCDRVIEARAAALQALRK